MPQNKLGEKNKYANTHHKGLVINIKMNDN